MIGWFHCCKWYYNLEGFDAWFVYTYLEKSMAELLLGEIKREEVLHVVCEAVVHCMGWYSALLEVDFCWWHQVFIFPIYYLFLFLFFSFSYLILGPSDMFGFICLYIFCVCWNMELFLVSTSKWREKENEPCWYGCVGSLGTWEYTFAVNTVFWYPKSLVLDHILCLYSGSDCILETANLIV